MPCNKETATKAVFFLLHGAAVLLLAWKAPPVVLAVDSARKFRGHVGRKLQKSRGRHGTLAAEAHPHNTDGRMCSRDAAVEVLLHAEETVLGIPYDFEDPREMEGYVNAIRDCAANFLSNMKCDLIREGSDDEDRSHQHFLNEAPQQMSMEGGIDSRIMTEKGNGGGYRGKAAAITQEQCCRDADAVRDMAVLSILSIEDSWAPNEPDGTYDLGKMQRRVNLGVYDNTRKVFTIALEALGRYYIQELGNELDPVCFSSRNN